MEAGKSKVENKETLCLVRICSVTHRNHLSLCPFLVERDKDLNQSFFYYKGDNPSH